MDESTANPPATSRRVGRPRRGTQSARLDDLIATATGVFLRDGYGGASIDKVAAEAGVSTRTIYERFKNKADLLAAVIGRLVERDVAAALASEELERMEPRQALMLIGQIITSRACDPDGAALFRILATEAHRFPELARKVRGHAKASIDYALIGYFRAKTQQGVLRISDPARAAVLFMQMVCAELHECLLFNSAEELTRLDLRSHLNLVVDIFVNGTMNRDRSRPAARPGDAA
jgi:AcrR family transcriptional regulator